MNSRDEPSASTFSSKDAEKNKTEIFAYSVSEKVEPHAVKSLVNLFDFIDSSPLFRVVSAQS